MYSFLQKMRVATFWAIFFTNSSGHPAFDRPTDAGIGDINVFYPARRI
jgi:hypothetical protein